MRVTTSAMMRNYQSSLSQSASNLESARMQVLTDGRKYTSVAEDPSSAARASQLYRKYQKNDDYISMVKDVQSRQDSQEAAVSQIATLSKTVTKSYSLEALNGTNGASERKVFATTLRSFQQSVVLSLNATYEDEFIFAGGGGDSVPFALSDDGKSLTYRGIDVNDTAALKAAGYDTEKIYVDLGFGLSFDTTGGIIDSSAFNTALPGINLVGFGKDDSGNSKNLVLLAGQMAEVLEADIFDSSKLETMVKTFEKGFDNLLNVQATLGTQTNFLTSTLNRLEDNSIALNAQIKNVERIDLTDAITNYSWAQYAYNAALRVGTSILSPSFIDFMK
ncbi:flagellin N-terminal helical domain-containing protein [Lachnospiraceae bacterium LCP25S3_G4]